MAESEEDRCIVLVVHSQAFRRARDIAIAAVPVCYVLGYFAWARATLRLGLGHVGTDANRLLTLGILSALLGSVLLAGVIAGSLLYRNRKNRLGKLFVLLIAAPIMGVIALGAYFAYLTLLDIFQPSWGALAFVVGYGLVALPLVLASSIFLEHLLRVALKKPPSHPRQVVLWVPLLLSLFAGGQVFPELVQHANSEIGGLLPREAVFELDAQAVPDGLGAILAPGNETASMQTVELWVLVHDDFGFQVRRRDADQANSALYHVPDASILAIRWLD